MVFSNPVRSGTAPDAEETVTIDPENLQNGAMPYLDGRLYRTPFGDAKNTLEIPVVDDNQGGSGAIWTRTNRSLNGLTRSESQKTFCTIGFPNDRTRAIADSSSMTVEEFIQKRFVPSHVMRKSLQGRKHYRSMLKHVINPESVDRIFTSRTRSDKPKVGLIVGWPYIGHMSLGNVQPDAVLKLVNAAFAHGYSSSTIVNIRCTISTIFAYAIEQSCFSGENPARSERSEHFARKHA